MVYIMSLSQVISIESIRTTTKTALALTTDRLDERHMKALTQGNNVLTTVTNQTDRVAYATLSRPNDKMTN